MKKQMLLGMGIVFLLCMGVYGWAYLVRPLDPISPPTYRQLQLGMTAAEVHTIIGLPPGYYYTRHPFYRSCCGPFLSPLRESGLPFSVWQKPRDGREVTLELWCGNTFWIGAALDENGVVVGHYLAQVKHPRDGPMTVLVDNLRVLLGL